MLRMKFYREPYWFKPYKIGYVAFYYPISWQGWGVSIITILILVHDFIAVEKMSHSINDTLVAFAIPAIGVLIIFNVITRMKGEYPHWWTRKRWKKDKESV